MNKLVNRIFASTDGIDEYEYMNHIFLWGVGGGQKPSLKEGVWMSVSETQLQTNANVAQCLQDV